IGAGFGLTYLLSGPRAAAVAAEPPDRERDPSVSSPPATAVGTKS
ncbi:MAG: hypothetical protein QOC85_1006, partial [Streptomyces sp.]|nr:hypothetical protein [Streptomyces sp.]